MELQVDFSDHPYQQKLWLFENRIVAGIAGIQGGKTYFGPPWCWREYTKFGGCDGLIVAPTYKVLNQSTMRKFLELTPKDWGKYSQTNGEYKTRWGHVFYCRTDHHSEAIEGMTVGWTWSDEASLFRADTFPRILGRGSILAARHLITSSVHKGQNWIYHDIYQPWKAGDTDIGLVQWRSKDSPYFADEEYEFQKRRMRSSLFRMRYDAQFEKLEGLIYDKADRDKMSVKPFNIPRNWPRWISVDFGINHAFVVGWWAYNEAKSCYYLYHLYYKRGAHIQEHAPQLVKHGRMKGIEIAYAGSGSEVQFRETLRLALAEKGIELEQVVAGYDSVATGIGCVYGLIAEDRFKVVDLPCMAPLWDETATYQYKEDATGNFTDDILDKDKYDVMDMVRYGLASRELVEEEGVY